MEKEKNRVSKGFLIVIILMSIIVITGASVAVYLHFNAPKKIDNKELDGGSVALTYSDDDSGITITNLTLLNDEFGKKQNSVEKYFDFSVATELEEASKIDYELSLVVNSKNTVPIKYIKIYLEKLNSGTFSSVSEPKLFTNLAAANKTNKNNSVVIYKDTLNKTGRENYRLRAWVDSASQYVIQPTDVISLNVKITGKAS